MGKRIGQSIYFSKAQIADYAKLMRPYRASIIDDLRNGVEWRYLGKNASWVERAGKRIEDSYFDTAIHELEKEGIVFWQNDVLQLSEDYK